MKAGDLMEATASTVIPGELIVAGDHMGVAVLLDGAMSDAMGQIYDQLAALTDGRRLGFNHFHITLKMEGELLEEDGS